MGQIKIMMITLGIKEVSIITIHPDGNVNVFYKFHGNPFSSSSSKNLKIKILHLEWYRYSMSPHLQQITQTAQTLANTTGIAPHSSQLFLKDLSSSKAFLKTRLLL